MLQRLYENACKIPSDINFHLPNLFDLSLECDHITELGVRNMNSSWAFLNALRTRGGKLVSVDIVSPQGINTDVVTKNCKNENVDFQFILGDSLKVELEPTDMLFIDTIHERQHLEKELELHAGKSKKYIAFHDVESCKEELMPVIERFLMNHKEWKKLFTLHFNNGLLVIKHV